MMNNRGQSEVIGSIIIVALVVVIASTGFYISFQLFNQQQGAIEQQTLQGSTIEFAHNIDSMTYTGKTSTEVRIPRGLTDKTEMFPGEKFDISINTPTDTYTIHSGQRDTELSVGRIQSVEGKRVIYSGLGAVFRESESGATTQMVKEPQITYKNGTLKVPFSIFTDRDVGERGGTFSLYAQRYSTTRLYPDINTSLPQIDIESVTFQIQNSTTADGWEEYFTTIADDVTVTQNGAESSNVVVEFNSVDRFYSQATYVSITGPLAQGSYERNQLELSFDK